MRPEESSSDSMGCKWPNGQMATTHVGVTSTMKGQPDYDNGESWNCATPNTVSSDWLNIYVVAMPDVVAKKMCHSGHKLHMC